MPIINDVLRHATEPVLRGLFQGMLFGMYQPQIRLGGGTPGGVANIEENLYQFDPAENRYLAQHNDNEIELIHAPNSHLIRGDGLEYERRWLSDSGF